MAKPVRRVITGHDKDGNAVVVIDGAAPNVRERKTANVFSTVMWSEKETPVVMRGGTADQSLGEIPLDPPPMGSVFRIVEMHPVKDGGAAVDHATTAAEIGAKPQVKSRFVAKKPRHPFIHRTDSIDYVVILEGEIDMLLDKGEVHLKAGDVVIQRGTNHAWVNRGEAPCRFAIVLVPGEVVP